MKEQRHICEGHEINYMRGTPAGEGVRCRNTAKYFRDGKWYCGIHDPEKIKEREERREKRAQAIQKAKIKTYGFRIGERIYEETGESEREAWMHLFGKIVEIDHLGELNTTRKEDEG